MCAKERVARLSALLLALSMPSCRWDLPWNLSVPHRTNCAQDGVVMPVCPNPANCPGVCVVPKGGSTAFKLGVQAELARTGTPLTYEPDCKKVHCARFPWPAWPAPERVVRIVRHPLARMLSAYLDGKHLRHWPWQTAFAPNASFADVVRRVTALPDEHVDPHLRRQTAMCGAPPSVPQTILKLEEYSTWRPWLLKELHWADDAPPATPISQAATAARVAEFYTPELRTLVLKWAAPDLERFGYAHTSSWIEKRNLIII